MLLFTIAIVAFLIWKVSQGRNWARITVLVFFVIGLLPSYFIVRSELGRSTSLGVFSILQAALQAYSLMLVFTTPAKQWFRGIPAKLSNFDPSIG